jgi:xanthine permease
MIQLGEKDVLNERISAGKLTILGFQHVLVMYSAAVIVPILLASALQLSQEDLAFLISADLFTCGIATFLQSFGLGKFVGIKLPVVLGCAVITLGPMISIGKNMGLPAIYGAILLSGVVVFLFSFVIHKILKFFPPVVTGSLVTIIGFSLTPLALQDMAGGFGSPTYGSLDNYFIGFLVLAIILVINRFCSGFTKAIAILLGLVLGTVIANFFGMVDFTQVGKAGWLKFVQPFYFGMPEFTVNGVVTMCIFLLINIVESVGIFYMIADICEVKISPRDIANGIRAEGCAQILGGIFNSFPYVTFSENAGLMTVTGVRNRYVLTAASVILIALGIIPKFAALTTIIPHPVLGGAMICLFGTIGANGIKILSDVDFKRNENLIIVACSVGIGLSTSVTPGLFEKMPELLKMLLGNGIFTGTFTAILLNTFFHYKEIMQAD